jgi:hypothetical protein
MRMIALPEVVVDPDVFVGAGPGEEARSRRRRPTGTAGRKNSSSDCFQPRQIVIVGHVAGCKNSKTPANRLRVAGFFGYSQPLRSGAGMNQRLRTYDCLNLGDP